MSVEIVEQARLLPQQIGPMQLLQMAVERGANIDAIERLSQLQTEMMNRAALKAFNTALHQAQSEVRRIGPDRANKQTSSRYASYAKLDSVLRPIYSKHGFSLSFNTGESRSDTVLVQCDVAHIDGHTSTYRIEMPADGKGAKGNDVMTRTHATGAAVSYGSRYLLKMIFNVAIGDEDDDGNGASGQKLHEHTLLSYVDSINSAANVEELRQRYMEAYKTAQQSGDKSAIAEFEAAKNKRKEALA